MLDFEDYQWAKDSLKTLEFFSMCNDEEILGMVENLEKAISKPGPPSCTRVKSPTVFFS